jgi:hypothetical protein
MTKDEKLAMDLALEALRLYQRTLAPTATQIKGEESITAIKQARSAPVQEPVAWVPALHPGHYITLTKPPESWGMVPLYTTPPAAQRQWVGLTDDEIDLFINGRGDEDDDDYVEPTGDGYGLTDADLVKLVRRAEAKLRSQNT